VSGGDNESQAVPTYFLSGLQPLTHIERGRPPVALSKPVGPRSPPAVAPARIAWAPGFAGISQSGGQTVHHVAECIPSTTIRGDLLGLRKSPRGRSQTEQEQGQNAPNLRFLPLVLPDRGWMEGDYERPPIFVSNVGSTTTRASCMCTCEASVRVVGPNLACKYISGRCDGIECGRKICVLRRTAAPRAEPTKSANCTLPACRPAWQYASIARFSRRVSPRNLHLV
jgi:hypothetical protein